MTSRPPSPDVTSRARDQSGVRNGQTAQLVSLVIETWNTGGDVDELRAQLARLAPQLATHAFELVITHVSIPHAIRDALTDQLATPVTWLELPASAGYYDHKNAGFDATSGDIVAFIDGDCEPSDGWLGALLAPFAAGAQVVAGATSYPGALAPLANLLDFPYFDGANHRRSFAATSADAAPTVRNFFANNVAFARETFAPRRYPSIAPMFHGQCQVLALQLLEENIPIAYAADARVTHAWPTSVREWLEVRLLRGADTTQLLPHVLDTYAPRVRARVTALGPLPTLAILAWRALTGARAALRIQPRLRGLALVAGVSAIDALGAAAAPAVYRYVAP